ncbi:MAG: hypothetical protein SFV23_12780 [Planctomycetaceae bacterium]|nr:hypothetical protein [Planctomycetaceae bacterium]
MTDRLYVSRDCDGLTKVWRHEPIPADGPTGTYYHGVTVPPLVVLEDSTAFPSLGLGQCGPIQLNEDLVTGDGEPRKHGKGMV